MEQIATDTLLIRCLSHDLERFSGVRFRELTHEDWESLLSTAARQRCRPQLFRSLDVPELEGTVPENVLSALREAYLNNAGRNLRLYRELGQILDGLRQDDVQVILLKGAHLARFVYGNIALRFMRDLDLMVHYRDVPKTVERLVGLGYQPSKEFALGATPPPSHQLPQFMKEGDLCVEVHWTIRSAGDPDLVDDEQLWARSLPVSVNGFGASALSPADLLLHLCVHAAYNHKFTMGLRPYLDIAEVIRHPDGELDWKQVQERTEEWGSCRGVYLALRLARELLGANVPPTVLDRLRPEDYDPQILRVAERQLFADKILDRTALPKLADLRGRGNMPETLKAMWRRIFPSFEYMSWHYPVRPGSPKIFFYYLVRWRDGLPSYGRMMARLLRGDTSAAQWAENRSKLSSWLAGAG